MPVRSRPLIVQLLLIAAAVLILVTVDIIFIHVGRAPSNRIHTLLVAALIVASIIATIKLLLDAQLRAIGSEFADVRAEVAFLRAEIFDRREQPTEPLPRVVIRGTAVVGTAVSPPLPIDPDVISIAERLHSRVNGSDDH